MNNTGLVALDEQEQGGSPFPPLMLLVEWLMHRGSWCKNRCPKVSALTLNCLSCHVSLPWNFISDPLLAQCFCFNPQCDRKIRTVLWSRCVRLLVLGPVILMRYRLKILVCHMHGLSFNAAFSDHLLDSRPRFLTSNVESCFCLIGLKSLRKLTLLTVLITVNRKMVVLFQCCLM